MKKQLTFRGDWMCALASLVFSFLIFISIHFRWSFHVKTLFLIIGLIWAIILLLIIMTQIMNYEQDKRHNRLIDWGGFKPPRFWILYSIVVVTIFLVAGLFFEMLPLEIFAVVLPLMSPLFGVLIGKFQGK